MTIQHTNSEPPGFLDGGGAMGRFIHAMDWSHTPLGPTATWPQSLRTTVSLCLFSNFAKCIVWGAEHTMIYNDGYRLICGGKHPHSMGHNFSECWASEWGIFGEPFVRGRTGLASFIENQRMFLDRNGHLEETFFNFSFCPIRDETGAVGGQLISCQETTPSVLSERRMGALRNLATRTAEAKSVEEVVTASALSLSDCNLDVPFAMFYAPDANAECARLIASTGLSAFACPETLSLQESTLTSWPVADVFRSGVVISIDGLEQRLGAPRVGPYSEPPKTALLLPILPAGADHPVAVLVLGVSPRLPLNEAYRSFYDLLAARVTAAIANARAFEEEKKRADALAAIDRAKTEFFANVSHEFRTPLTLMLGPLENMLLGGDSELSPAAQGQLEIVNRNGRRLLRLVNTLLDFSRIEAGRARALYQPTDLAVFTTDIASVFRSACERAGLRLSVDCPPLPEPAYIDHEMWEKIVLNLLSNAFKFTFEGEIAVALRQDGGSVRLRVRDTGTGIPSEQIPRLFERFQRVSNARARTYEGSGIGLALVQELARLHGGSVRVESVLGRGATFIVTIPLGRAHLPQDQIDEQHLTPFDATDAAPYVEDALRWLPDEARAQKDFFSEVPTFNDISAIASPNGRHVSPGVNAARVLIADDNADMRDYIARLLAGRYHVDACADGAAALETARAHKPDLIVTDIMMPQLDGFGLLREIRADQALRETPVIMLSARSGEESRIEGMQAGADDYLIKPFSARELVARVEAHLKMASLRAEGQQAIRASEAQLAIELSDSQQLQRISSKLIKHDNINVLYDDVLVAARALMRSDMASIQRLVPERNELFLLSHHGFTPESARHWEWVSAQHSSACGVAMAQGKAVAVADVELWEIAAGTEDLAHFRHSGIRAVLSVPLVARDGHCVGMLSTHWRSVHRPSERELRLFDVLARQAADLIERHDAQRALLQLNQALEQRVAERTAALDQQTVRLTQLAAELMDSEERARKNIAAILHEDLQQVLVAALMQVSVQAKSERFSPDYLSELLKEAVGISRNMVRELSPVSLRDSTLPEALDWLADWFAEHHSHLIDVDIAADFPTLSEGSNRFVFDMVRELLLNIVKHAGVRMATVRLLTSSENTLHVEVSDKGKGFDPDNGNGEGFGLFNIRERLTALGGGMVIQSAPGKGARFKIRLPFSGESAVTQALADQEVGPTVVPFPRHTTL
jgi:signal transduction histidine kinase